MSRIVVVSEQGTEVEIGEDDLPRYQSFGYSVKTPQQSTEEPEAEE
jgi:hypothetical protein